MLYNEMIKIIRPQTYIFLMIRTVFQIILFTIFAVHAAPIHAQDWTVFESESGLFEARFPDNVKENYEELRLNNGNVIYSGQATSTLDYGTYKQAAKNYIIKYEQTFAGILNDKDISELLANELALYASHFSQLGGVQKSRKDVMYHTDGTPGGEISLSYQDPELGEQHMRARILFTDSAKIQHIVIGPEDIMHSLQTRNFFDSLYIKGNFRKKAGSIKNEWDSIRSNFGIFTAYLPQATPPYVSKPYSVKSSNKAERIRIQFYDPVWKDSAFYGIYGYRLNRQLTEFDVKTILKNKHILRQRFSANKVTFKSLENDGFPVLEAQYSITPSKANPFATQAKLRAHYSGNVLMVHELIGSHRQLRSKFIDHVVRNVEFHPEQAEKIEAPPPPSEEVSSE